MVICVSRLTDTLPTDAHKDAHNMISIIVISCNFERDTLPLPQRTTLSVLCLQPASLPHTHLTTLR